MANILQKLLKQPQLNQRIITSFYPRKPSNLLTPLSLHQPQINQTKPDHNYNPPNPIWDSNDKTTRYDSLHIYPCFPFGYCSNPISQSGFVPVSEEKVDGMESDEGRMMWADSVKKKRKKKMNKHKLRKLRKRLGRQT